jgi:hypothetical protein
MPEELFAALQQLAQREHRSINGQILYVLEAATGVHAPMEPTAEERAPRAPQSPGPGK